MPDMVGYLGLLRGNRAFRRLWCAQVTSQLGDWLDQIALYTLVLRLSGGSGQALGGLMVAQFLPRTLAGLFGGAALGGVVAGTLGTSAALLADSASFLLSAWWTWSVRIPEAPRQAGQRPGALRELAEGFGYLMHNRDAAVYALSKTMWSVGGGGVL